MPRSSLADALKPRQPTPAPTAAEPTAHAHRATTAITTMNHARRRTKRPNDKNGTGTTIAAVLGHADVSATAIYTTAIGAEHRELVARVWTTP